MRIFFALWPSPQSARRLAMIAAETAARIGGRPMREETIHLTLAFLGEVPEERAPELLTIGESLRTPAFHLRIDRLDHWRHNRLIWAGCSEIPVQLEELASRLRSELAGAGFPVDNGKLTFTPHVTLMRKVPGFAAETRLPAIEPIKWTCPDFVLVCSHLSSDGPNYELLARFPLRTD
jgi:2'-5' RNA ligase